MITDQKQPKTDEKQPKFYGKTKQALDLVVNHGVDEKTAMVLSGCSPNARSGNLYRFKEKVRKYSLTAPKMVKLAHKAIQDTLEMKPVTYQAQKVCAGIGVVDYEETIMPSHTNRLTAANIVMDRYDPIVHKSVNLTGQVSISPVDLLEYMGSEKKQ